MTEASQKPEPDAAPSVAPGDVVQLDPDKCRHGPVFVVVEEVKHWGVQGYFLVVPEGQSAAAAYIRVNHGDFVRIGRAEWTVEFKP